MADLEARDIGLRSLNEQIDTTTANGRLMFHMFSALSEFERGLLVERTKAGLQAAKAKGRTGGRPAALGDHSKTLAREMHTSGKTVTQIADTPRVSRATIYREFKATA